jgi:hypothetical protein
MGNQNCSEVGLFTELEGIAYFGFDFRDTVIRLVLEVKRIGVEGRVPCACIGFDMSLSHVG